ncbi:GNAT family N-acetyltransferase [bacterium]|nr:GNAT family N-acetyltransferase [bacterium]|tara:strand:- start:1877 stop:2395 length:519 start_codon:yes stop_codon:yes gene_type:complete
MIIKSERFTLRPYKASDLDSLVESINNEKVSRYMTRVPFPYTEKDGQEWIERCQKEYKEAEPKEINLAIEIDGKVVGGIGFTKIEKKYQAGLGYWLAESYWNQGIMTEATKLIIEFGLEKLELIRIYGHVFGANIPSTKVLKKAGFELEGIMKKGTKKDGKFFNRYLFAKVR